MTNFEYYTESPAALEELLYGAVDDALSARGCTMRLKLPPDECEDWQSWLKAEYDGGLPSGPLLPEPPPHMTPEQHNAQILTDKLEDILKLWSKNTTPFAQSARKILNQAIDGVRALVGGGDNL